MIGLVPQNWEIGPSGGRAYSAELPIPVTGEPTRQPFQ